MNRLKNKTVLITGASAGIGRACAHQFATAGANVLLNARRAERVQELAAELQQKHQVRAQALVFDVTDLAAMQQALAGLDQSWQQIDILINNAGLALGTELTQDGDVEDWSRMIDTNIKGLLYMTRQVLPSMLERDAGHIVNIGSIAGLETYTRGNVYCATKHAVHALNKSMRIDLNHTKIRVTEINPGAVHTEFSEVRWKGDREKSEAFYADACSLDADNVADAIIYATCQPATVNIEQLVITAVGQASVNHMLKKSGSGGAFDV